ncbi:hypothetical protein [Desertivirga arenae]|uniref:hypothetical protein n=1 Tax=Desertivirga arenae TaxID=2810309 RepID=UPI001A96C5F5|nr:hypothetical protein [Pedobacter sp. SYSU D00823]
MEIAFFKRHQRGEIYHYYKVYGGPGKTKHGYQEVINFLNEKPIISIEHNYPYDPINPDKPFELTGTWCTYEVGTPISDAEYLEAYKKATAHLFTII